MVLGEWMDVRKGKREMRLNCGQEHLFNIYYVPGTCYIIYIISNDFHNNPMR